MKIKKEVLLIAFILIIVIGFLYKIFVFPSQLCLKTLYTQYNSNKELLESRKNKLSALDSIKETNLKLQEKLAMLDVKFVKSDVISCMEEFSILAKNTGNLLLGITSVEPAKVAEEGIARYTIKLKINGQYVDIIRFLNELWAQERLTVIDEAEILIAQEGLPTLEGHFEITYFVIKEFLPLEKERSNDNL